MAEHRPAAGVTGVARRALRPRVGGDETGAADRERLCDRPYRTGLGHAGRHRRQRQRIVRHPLAVDPLRRMLGHRCAIRIVHAVVVVVEDVDDRRLAIERRLARRAQHAVGRLAETPRIVDRDVAVMEVAEVQEEVRAAPPDGLEDHVVRPRRRARAEGEGERERPVGEGAEPAGAMVAAGRRLDCVAIRRIGLKTVGVEGVDAVRRGRPGRRDDARRRGVASIGRRQDHADRAVDRDAGPDARAARRDRARPHPVDRGGGPLHRGEQVAGAGGIDCQAGRREPGGASEQRPPAGARRSAAAGSRHRVGPSGRDSSHHFESWWRARIG